MQTVEQRRRSTNLICDINVVGFLSILLVLLFTYMAYLGTGHRTYSFGHADVPSVNHPVSMPGADRDDAMIISINRDGRVYFGNDNIDLSALPVIIQNRIKSGSPKVVYFRADARARYKSVRDVLEAVQASGLEKVAFLMEQRKIDGRKPY